MKLTGKVALVTGAGQGIGRGIAEVFAREGADVVINDICTGEKTDEVAAAVRSAGRRALVVKADVSKRVDVERMFEEAQTLGPIDILVNNAGIETIVPFLELTDQQWEDVTNINLKAGWMCAQTFCRRAIQEGRTGAIVNIGSIQAARVLPGRTHYAPSKLAIEALTRNISAEVGLNGIRVNCIHPGLIDTPMIRWVLESPEILPQVVAQISLGHPGNPCDIGHAAAFLASDEARYITGQSIYVDGGWVGK
jgi:glucose 1-dehydrogenase/3-oxoacyl-[acyl-carrier protein] reductase